MQPLIEPMLTAEDLFRLPDDGVRHELSAGLLLSEPLPGARHGQISFRIGALIDRFVQERGLGTIFGNDTGFVLARSPDTVRGPDVAFVTKERMAALGDLPTYFPGPPDLAVEVVSPSNRPADVRAKVAEFLAAGTRLVWVVDPEKRTVTAYRSLLSPRVFTEEEVLEGEDVLPGFRLPVREVFAA